MVIARVLDTALTEGNFASTLFASSADDSDQRTDNHFSLCRCIGTPPTHRRARKLFVNWLSDLFAHGMASVLHPVANNLQEDGYEQVGGGSTRGVVDRRR